MAKLAGVSEATVSRVLNGIGPVKEETRQRVLQAAARLDYYPSAIARSFARNRSGNLGVILPFVPKVRLFSTYYFSEILSGIGETVKEKAFQLMLMFRSPDEPMDYTALFRTRQIDACIILGSQDVPGEREALLELTERSYPFCLVNQRYDGLQFSGVDADHVGGSCEAVKHLLSQGIRRIAFLNGPRQFSNSEDRLAGYKMALAEAGVPYRPEDVFLGNYSRKSGYEAAAPLYDRFSQYEAVFTANDRMAIGVLQGMRERGLEAGKHYALVGYDDSDASRLTVPQLTSVHVPFYEMGKIAAEQLLAQVEQERNTVFYKQLSTSLIIRLSSRLERAATDGGEAE